MGDDKGAKYVGAVIRILLGLLPIAAGVYLLVERDDWVPDAEKFQRYALTVAAGTLLLVSGVLGVVKRRREARAGRLTGRSGAPVPSTLGRKMMWHFGAVLLTLPIAAVIVFGSRAYNIYNAETSLFESAQRLQTPEGWEDYDRFVVQNHRQLAQSRVDVAAEQRGEEALERFGIGDDDWPLRMRDRAARPRVSWEDSLFRAQDLGGWLDALTPVHEHMPLADVGYRESRFAEAVAAGTVRALRVHRAEFPSGPHWEETAEALRQHYRDAEERYTAMTANGQGEPEGVAGLKALLGHLRDTDVDQTAVPVSFLPVTGLDAHVFEAALGESLGGASVLPVEPAFTAEQNELRQGSITRRISAAFQTVVGDLFTVTAASLEESRSSPRFLMEYAVRPTGNVYLFEGQEALPPAEREVLVGIAMRFHATIQVPTNGPLPDDRSVGHHFTLEGAPAERIRGGAADAPPAQRAAAAYGAMAQSAFSDFEHRLVAAYGLGG